MSRRIYTVNEVVDALESLHGQEILIKGLLSLEFEGNQLVHIPTAEYREGASSLRADVYAAARLMSLEDLRSLSSRRVIVTAIVDAGLPGHEEASPGGLRILRVDRWKMAEEWMHRDA